MEKDWIVFSGDEFNIDLQIRGSWVWAKKGSKPLFPCQTRKGKIKIFGALNNKKGKVVTLSSKKIDRFAFIKFLKKLMRYYKKVFLIVDNASWHKAKEVKEFLVINNERIRISYFPPYSPEYNPSEYCWKAVKRDLLTRKLFLSTESMEEQVLDYFRKKSFFGLKLERYLSP